MATAARGPRGRGRDGTPRDESFYATVRPFDVRHIVETYTGRRSIGTTFRVARSELRIQTTRGWIKRTVLRAIPRLFGRYSVVAMLHALPPPKRRGGGVAWPRETAVTYSDAPAAVRRWIWAEGILAHLPDGPSIQPPPPSIREFPYAALAPRRR